MAKNKILMVRVDERTGLIIDELSDKLGASKSRVIRVLLQKSIDEIIDEKGNIKINAEKQV